MAMKNLFTKDHKKKLQTEKFLKEFCARLREPVKSKNDFLFEDQRNEGRRMANSEAVTLQVLPPTDKKRLTLSAIDFMKAVVESCNDVPYEVLKNIFSFIPKEADIA
jgi:hypothetical protein